MKIFRFGRILKNLRKDRGDTQADLAKYLGISRSAISMYESGEREPDFETLEAIADYFNVNMNFLLGQTEDPYDYENDSNNRLGDEASDSKRNSLVEMKKDEIRRLFDQMSPDQQDMLLLEGYRIVYGHTSEDNLVKHSQEDDFS